MCVTCLNVAGRFVGRLGALGAVSVGLVGHVTEGEQLLAADLSGLDASAALARALCPGSGVPLDRAVDGVAKLLASIKHKAQ